MAALDTNVLVRFLVRDDDAQFARAQRLIAAHRGDEFGIFVPVTVALELEWVLRSRYRFAKREIVDTYAALLSTTELAFEAESALEMALHDYKTYTTDFADCLHLALAKQAGHAPMHTFDRRAAALPGVRLLE